MLSGWLRLIPASYGWFPPNTRPSRSRLFRLVWRVFLGFAEGRAVRL